MSSVIGSSPAESVSAAPKTTALLASPLAVTKPAPAAVKTAPQQPALAEDEVVLAREGQRLNFTKDVIEITNKKRCCVRAKKNHEIKYSDIQNTAVEWYCFSGALVIKESETTHRFKFGKVRLMQAASALRRRMEKSDGKQKDTVTKIKTLLDGYPDVGVTNTGLITKKKRACCSCVSTAAYIPWKSIVALRMTRTCCSGVITITAKTEEDVQAGGTKRFGKDTSETTINIKIHRSTSEGLYQPLTTIMSKNFSHMEELEGMHINNTNGHVKVTKAGMFLDSEISSCGAYVKSFLPWGSMVAMTYRNRGCCKKATFRLRDRLQAPVDVGSVSYADFEEVRKVFSKAVAEGPLPGQAGEPVARGLTLNQEGMHAKKKRCCRMRQLFSPWAKIDGLTVNMGSCGCSGTIHLITEAGHDFTVFKSRKKELLWQKFDEIHKWKYGASGAGSNKLCFNEDQKDSRKTCVLTDQSLRLCSRKGKTIQEVDLERVIGARAAKKGKKAIDVALNVGQNKCAILHISVQGTEAAELAEAICKRSTKRKNEIKKLTGLEA